MQRRISVNDIKALTKSTRTKTTEFIVHIRRQYDYHFESDFRSEMFDALKYVYWMKN